ncbi:MAG TPA: hypothetical protein VLI06_00840 [Solimonas sp.]|nr:hypothetical protein [Solimonas sp.]
MLNRLAPVLLTAFLLATGLASLLTGVYHFGSTIGTFMMLIGLMVAGGSLTALLLAGSGRYG